MAKKTPETRMQSYGIYHHWDSQSRDVPKIKTFTLTVPAEIGIEFGYVLELKGARGMKLSFEIDHPPFSGEDGEISPPFTGEQYVRTTPYLFYLGDTIWAPKEDKIGLWKLTTWLDGKEIACKTFRIA